MSVKSPTIRFELKTIRMHCKQGFQVFFAIAIVYDLSSAGVYDEKELFKRLFNDYNKYTMPRINNTEPISIQISCGVSEMLNLDETENSLTLNVFFAIRWKDDLLTWNSSQYNETDMILAPTDKIWLPDIVVGNGIGESKTLSNKNEIVRLSSDGNIAWWPYSDLKTLCDVDITKYPFDRQTCHLQLDPWVADASMQVFRAPNVPDTFDSYKGNSQWILVKSQNFYKSVYVEPYTFSRYIFQITLQRRSLYYILNTIFPVILMSGLNLCCFLIPPECGEKMTLSISIFLTFAVYMTIISGEMPKSSTRISLFGLFLCCQLLLSGLTIVLESVVLHFYFKGHQLVFGSTLECQMDKNVNDTENSERHFINKSGNEKKLTHKELALKLDKVFVKVITCINVVSIIVFFITTVP